MPANTRAVLRNCHGDHMQALNAEEIESYEFLAERGEIIRSTKMKKGRLCIIFRLLPPELPAVKPSESDNSQCSLTDGDELAFAGVRGPVTIRQIERWLGWGLIVAPR